MDTPRGVTAERAAVVGSVYLIGLGLAIGALTLTTFYVMGAPAR